MRSGEIAVDGGVERFTCGPVGDGWAYAGVRLHPGTGAELARLHLQVDGAGVTTRLHAQAGGWVLRGGCVGASALWRRAGASGQDAEEREALATGFTGTSPAYTAALVRRLRVRVGESVRVRLVEVTEPVLGTRLVDQSWARESEQEWAVTDLATGERRVVGPALTLL